MTATSRRFVTPNPGVDAWTAWTGHGATFLLIPVSPTEVYGYASGNRGDGPRPTDSMAQAFTGFPAEVTRSLEQLATAPVPAYHSPVEEVRITSWNRGRVVLVGDAARATGPVWAQGAAMAMEDALVLAGLLATTDDWSGVGAAWESRRRPRVAHVQAATDRMSRLAGMPDWISHTVAPLLGPRSYRAAYGPLRTPPAPDAGDAGPPKSSRPEPRR